MTHKRALTTIPWLAGIALPQEWKQSKLKHLALTMRAGETITSEAIDPAGRYPVYGGNGLRGYTNDHTHAGQHIIIGRQGALCGNVHLVSGEFWASEHAIVVTTKSEVHPHWLAYLLRVMDLGQYSQTAAQPGIGTAQISNLPVPVPATDEQRAIADYLDRETAQIDTLIEEQQRLVDLLRERRKSMVEHAVFFGLDGAPRTARAERWLPDSPRHWEVVQLGFVSDTLSGFAFPSEGFTKDDGDKRLLRGVNIKPDGIDWTDTVRWNAEESPVPAEYLLCEGDLVLGMDRPFVRGGVRICALTGKDLPALLLQRVMRIRPHPQGDPEYFRNVVTTGAFITYLEPLFTGVSVPHVSEWQVRKFKMPFPPLDEQRRIVAYLDEQTAKIDTLITETELFIELARERRSALITAAVTGQINVRDQVD